MLSTKGTLISPLHMDECLGCLETNLGGCVRTLCASVLKFSPVKQRLKEGRSKKQKSLTLSPLKLQVLVSAATEGKRSQLGKFCSMIRAAHLPSYRVNTFLPYAAAENFPVGSHFPQQNEI